MRQARRFGPLMVSTCAQGPHAPRIDVGTAHDDDGRRYRVIVFGAGPRARVVGLRGTGNPPPLNRLPWVVPAPMRPAARFLFAMRPGR